MTQPTIEVTPEHSRVDEDLTIVATGLAPSSLTELRTRVVDQQGVEWTSSVEFYSDSDGQFDTSWNAPRPGGSYADLYRMGPLWSVTSDGGAFFAVDTPEPLSYSFSLHEVASDDEDPEQRPELASTAISRHFGEHIAHVAVREGPIVGTLHYPHTDTPIARNRTEFPGVLLLGGSDGDRLDHAGSLLAAQGFTVLALSYFGVAGRPEHLIEIDLDDIDAAVSYLVEHDRTSGGEVSLIGASRGAELALQIAAANRQVGLVIASAPSALRVPGVDRNFTNYSRPAWTRGGKPLPFNPGKVRMRDWVTMAGRSLAGKPMGQKYAFERDLEDPAKVAKAAISVESCKGPLVLISGETDELWPSTSYADLIINRLAEHDWPGDVRDIRLTSVGHFAAFPYNIPSLPPMNRIQPSAAFTIDFGGTPDGHARASWSTWDQIRDALDDWAAAL